MIDSAYVEQSRQEWSRTDQPVEKMSRKFVGLITERKCHKCDTERALPIIIIIIIIVIITAIIIFGPRRDKVTGELKKLHNQELNDLNSSPSIVRVIKSRRMRWAGHIVRMGRGEEYTGFWWGNLREKNHFGDPVVDWRLTLR